MSVQKARLMFISVAAVFSLFLWLFTPAQKQLVAQVATPPANATTAVIPFPTPEESLFCEIDPDNQIPCYAAMLLDQLPPQNLPALSNVACVGGMAGSYPCQNIDLLSFTPLAQMGGGNGNDIWGWTDPLNGREYALMGLTNGTSFVDITDPLNPVYLGRLPTHTSDSAWRDLKVYQNHAFIVSEAGSHGIQIFDLTQLRSVVNPPVIFANTAHYNLIGSAHNIAINEDTGFAYAVGASSCSGGLHMVNIITPTVPTSAGCFSAHGYIHDTQCVVYNGPDVDYVGQEICFNSNSTSSSPSGTKALSIVNVTNKVAATQISRTLYPFSAYSHQGWLTEDQHYFLMNDELDEQRQGVNTKTHIWNVADLDAPLYLGAYTGPVAAIDHNLYIRGDLMYQSNYRSGLRVLNIEGIGSQLPTEVGYFDVFPASNSANFNGTWSNYPYFPSGNIIVSGIEQGLFVLRLNESLVTPTPTPTITPTSDPNSTPTTTPTATPTLVPTATPTIDVTPTAEPTATPTIDVTPTAEPTATPTVDVTPTAEPSQTPTLEPTPTAEPTATSIPPDTSYRLYLPLTVVNNP